MSKKKRPQAEKKGPQPDVRIGFLLDRTGSMAPLVDDVIGGFNAFLEEQARQTGTCSFTLTLFDSVSIDTQTYGSIKAVPKLTKKTYVPRALTPLLDAAVRSINALEASPPAKRTLMVIYTDGQENASRETTKDNLQALVAEKTEDGWDFIFLGADIDAYAEGARMSFTAPQVVSTNSAQTGQTFAAVSASVSSYRGGDSGYMSHLKNEEKRQRGRKQR